MNRILYQARCRCKEESSITKKRKKKNRIQDSNLCYPNPETELVARKTFQIRYEKRLSSIAKLVLSSFQSKYIYYGLA